MAKEVMRGTGAIATKNNERASTLERKDAQPTRRSIRREDIPGAFHRPHAEARKGRVLTCI